MLRSTQDRWMMKAGNFKGKMSKPIETQPNKFSQHSYEYLHAITKDVAETLGILPHQAQAGVWTSIKARWEAVAPPIQRKYVKRGMMRKSMKVNEKTGMRERIGPWEIKPEHARQYNDEIFWKAMKVDLPSSAFDEAGRSFDFFFDRIAKKYDAHSMDELSPFIKEGRVTPWDAQGIPHRVSKGKVELLEPSFEGVVDSSSLRQNQIAEALIKRLRGDTSEATGKLIEKLGGTAGLERFLSGKPLLSPY